MKKLLILSSCLLFLVTSNAQKPGRTYEEYMLKSQKRTTAAWVFLGSGVALTAGGTALLASGINDSNRDYGGVTDDGTGKIVGGFILVFGGVALMGTSIPFFIMSHRYKKKAMRLALNTQKIQLPGNYKISTRYYPALSLRINLGH